MIKEYYKISNLYMFDEKCKSIIGYNPEFEYLKDNIWIGTEKKMEPIFEFIGIAMI